MTQRRSIQHAADGRAFRWPLHPLEAKLDGDLESARLALALLQHEERRTAQEVQQCSAQQEGHQVAAAACLERAPALRAHVLGYLAELDAKLAQVQASASKLQQEVDAARGDCIERQRQLACVQRLHDAAERSHVQERRRRASREADAAWLVHLQQHRSRIGGAAG
jgi:flagellar biosynthesis chaperone FliJ